MSLKLTKQSIRMSAVALSILSVMVAWGAFTPNQVSAAKVCPAQTKRDFGVKIVKGNISCGAAKAIFNRYFDSDAPCEGSGCLREIDGWTCLTAAQIFYPRIASCNTERGGHIQAYGIDTVEPGAETDHNDLARRFRPYLFFDTSEKFRPLDVDKFLRRDEILVCHSPNHGCKRLTGKSRLLKGSYSSAGDFMNQQPGSRTDPNQHYTATTSCRHEVDGNTRLDCDDSSENAIYYQVAGQASHYIDLYINYWFFYRYNDVPGHLDVGLFDKTRLLHEGDWEGITVALSSLNTGTFSYVAFAEHENVWRYLRDTLRCSGDHTRGCGSDSRVNAYVASGTHATYPRRCSESLIANCNKTGSILPEAGYDGHYSWGRNSDSAAVKRLPDADESPWVDWPGNWNEDEAPRITGPARQKRYNDPWESIRCTTRWYVPIETGFNCSNFAASVHKRPIIVADQGGEKDCASWFGPEVVVETCNPKELASALDKGTFGKSGDLTIKGSNVDTASVPGLAQAVGDLPAVGDKVTITGQADIGTQLTIRAKNGGSILTGQFTDLGLEKNGVATVRVEGSEGQAVISLTHPGGTKVYSTLLGATTTILRPNIISAKRRLGRVVVKFRATSRKSAIKLKRSCQVNKNSSRHVTSRPGQVQTVSLKAAKRYNSVQVVDIKNKASSKCVKITGSH